MAGLPKKYAKMGFKRGWAAYRRSKSKPRTASRTSRPRKVKTMARRRYGRRRGGHRSKSIGIVPTVTTILPSVITFASDIKGGFTVQQSANDVVMKLTGFNMGTGKFNPDHATNGMIAIGGIAVTYIGRKLRLNRYVPLPKGIKIF